MGPIIQIGAGRSGSTLLSRMFAAHGAITFLGETDFLTYRVWREVAENPFWYNWSRYVGENPSDAFGHLPAVSEEERAQFLAHCGRKVAELVKGVLGAENSDVWGFKEIWNGSAAHNVPWEPYDHVFPDALWVHLIRHPLHFAISSAQWNRDEPDVNYLRQRCVDWVAIIRKSRERWKTGRFVELRYEDLVQTGVESLTRVLERLGLAFDERCALALDRKVLASNRGASSISRTVCIGEFENDVAGLRELCGELGYDSVVEGALENDARSKDTPRPDLRKL